VVFLFIHFRPHCNGAVAAGVPQELFLIEETSVVVSDVVSASKLVSPAEEEQ
jgi:hypothetical protein